MHRVTLRQLIAGPRVEVESPRALRATYKECREALRAVLGCATTLDDPSLRKLHADCQVGRIALWSGYRMSVEFDLTPIDEHTTHVLIRSRFALAGWLSPGIWRERHRLLVSLGEHLART